MKQKVVGARLNIQRIFFKRIFVYILIIFSSYEILGMLLLYLMCARDTIKDIVENRIKKLDLSQKY